MINGAGDPATVARRQLLAKCAPIGDALDVKELRELGIAVQEEMPREVYDLMDLFPQTSQRRPGVEFIPLPYAPAPPAMPRKTER